MNNYYLKRKLFNSTEKKNYLIVFLLLRIEYQRYFNTIIIHIFKIIHLNAQDTYLKILSVNFISKRIISWFSQN